LSSLNSNPLFFLDYFASRILELDVSESALKGSVEGCLQSKMALIGVETAEMPGMFQKGDDDLAGFSVGEVKKPDLIDGLNLKEGDSFVGIACKGFHSKGFFLVRKILGMNNSNLDFNRVN
jgi:phosphoribosylformylglycinamidine cyclo-ligase